MCWRWRWRWCVNALVHALAIAVVVLCEADEDHVSNEPNVQYDKQVKYITITEGVADRHVAFCHFQC